MSTFELTLESNNINFGTVVGGGSLPIQEDNGAEYATATITATPGAGYSFLRWSNGDETATTEVTIYYDTNLTAYFYKEVSGLQGTGLSFDPYIIDSPEAFAAMCGMSSVDSQAYFQQAANIDLNEIGNLHSVAEWLDTLPEQTPYFNGEFLGQYDGSDNIIRGAYTTTNESFLFKSLGSGARISDLSLDMCYAKPETRFGSFAGKINNTEDGNEENNHIGLSYCIAKNVFIEAEGSNAAVGGLVGEADYSGASLELDAGEMPTVNHIYRGEFRGVIKSTRGGAAGGIVGTALWTTLELCANKGLINIESDSSISAGGILGSAKNSFIVECFSRAPIEVVSAGVIYIGGLVGGNLALSETDSNSIEDSFCSGDIEHTKLSGSPTGIICGVSSGAHQEILRCYYYGRVDAETGITTLPIGADSVTACFYLDSSVDDYSTALGTVLTVEDFTDEDIFTDDGWGFSLFSSGWVMDEQLARPNLVMNMERPDVTLLVTSSQGGLAYGSGVYAYEDMVEISAEAEAGYKFLRWTDGIADPERTIPLTENVSLMAIFVAEGQNLKLVDKNILGAFWQQVKSFIENIFKSGSEKVVGSDTRAYEQTVDAYYNPLKSYFTESGGTYTIFQPVWSRIAHDASYDSNEHYFYIDITGLPVEYSYDAGDWDTYTAAGLYIETAFSGNTLYEGVTQSDMVFTADKHAILIVSPGTGNKVTVSYDFGNLVSDESTSFFVPILKGMEITISVTKGTRGTGHIDYAIVQRYY